MANVNLAPSQVLFAGDSNLKFVERFVSYQDRDKVKVLSLPGASIVDDKTGFSRSLHRHIVVYKPDTICLHLGSNDADRGKTSLVYRLLSIYTEAGQLGLVPTRPLSQLGPVNLACLFSL